MIVDTIRPLKLKYILILSMGIFSTMPILGIPFGGRYITVFSITFILNFCNIVWEVFRKNQFSFMLTSIKKVYLIFLIWPIMSYLIGLVYMPKEWHSSMTSYIIRVIEYLLLTILLYIDNDKENARMFGKGLFYGIVVNAVWSIFEAISYYFFSESLNDILFSSYLGLNREILLWNRYGGIRVSGLNYDPAHLGGILPILLFCGLAKKNIYIIVLSIISLVFSQSTTALVGCIAAIAIFLLIRRKRTKKRLKLKLSLFAGIVIMIFVSIIMISYERTINHFINSIIENIGGYIERINTIYLGSANRIEPREVYYTQAINRLLERNPIVSLIGSGLGTSMYPFRNVSGLFATGAQSTVTEIETNYIAYLFDLGIIGFIIYIVLLIKGFLKFMRALRHKKEFPMYLFLGFFISVICCSALYHYIFTAYQMLTFTFATIYIDYYENEKKGEIYNVGLYNDA